MLSIMLTPRTLVCVCVLSLLCIVQDIANVMWALGTLSLSTLQPLMGQDTLHSSLRALLDCLQQQQAAATPQVGHSCQHSLILSWAAQA